MAVKTLLILDTIHFRTERLHEQPN